MKIKHSLLIVISILGIAMGFTSCEEAPQFSMTGPESIEASADGGSATISITANRDWTAFASDSWVSVSPSSGKASDGPVTVTIRCSANTNYDPRSTMVTVRMEDQTRSVRVTQAQRLGIEIPTKLYDLSSESSTIDVEVRANVQYSVSVSDSWIRQTGTKALVSNKLTFSIDENKSYDARSATISVKADDASVPEQVIMVKQAQMDALIVDRTSYDMPYGGGEIDVKVDANVSFDVRPDVEWISYVSTKALTTSTFKLAISENTTTVPREGTVEIAQKDGNLSYRLTVKQGARVPVESIELDKTVLSLVAGRDAALNASVKPANATDKTITWSSSDSRIVTVDQDGKVKAVSKGNAVITATCSNFTISCRVFVKAADYPVPSGAVDLGLSVVWASKNLGAESISATGEYYLWGDPTGDEPLIDFHAPDMDYICGTQYDVAMAKLGKGWRLPTRSEMEELLSSCTWEKVAGLYKLTGPNGNSIGLPWTGMVYPGDGPIGTTTVVFKDNGYMMTGESYDSGYGRFAYSYYLDQDFKYNWVAYNAPLVKVPVRPVFESLDGAIHVTSVRLDKSELSLIEGESAALVPALNPEDATDKSVKWSSSNPGVASVENGKLTAIKAGTSTITVTTVDGGKTATCAVTVRAKSVPVSSVSLDHTEVSMLVGQSAALTATVGPENATDKNVRWSSSDESVAVVTATGVVSARAAGTATITVTTVDGGKTATCKFTITEPYITLGKNEYEVGSPGDTLTLDITANVDYSIKSDVTWIKVSGNTLEVAENTFGVKRTGTVTVSNDKFKIKRTVTVVQEKSPNGIDGGSAIVLP